MNTQIIIETEDAVRILHACGVNAFVVFSAIQALGHPCSVQQIQMFSGLTEEEVREAATRLGFYQLGIMSNLEHVKLPTSHGTDMH
ncbi:hypothetical protein ACOALA_20870 (plasmid) [Alicyclobacillus acidoterrestris]|uniref:hypothetical protein n=1 Tax=Alicyclobacillus acidoterrestris TaxID=1450 RepID=UPI003F533907